MRLRWIAALSLALTACGDDGPKSDSSGDVGITQPDASGDVAADGPADSAGDGASDASTDGVADAPDDSATGDAADSPLDAAPDLGDVAMGMCGPVEPTRVFVVSELFFVGETDGVTRGFDVDGVTSSGADPIGCRKPDMVTAEGAEGVDNQFARVLPIIENTGGMALPGLIQNAINSGDILIMFELENVDGLEDDECVGVSISRGEGDPFVDMTNRLEPGQTFERNLSIAAGRYEEGTIEDGVLRAGPLDFTIPAYVFFYSLLLPISGGILEVEFDDDGSVTGLMGGGVSVAALSEQLAVIEGDGGATDAVISVLPGLADLFPDETGQCTNISASLAFRAVPAFYYE